MKRRIIILGAILIVAIATVAMTTRNADGLLGDCRRLIVAGDKLIAGGYFEKADRRVVNNIAQFDGTKWSGLAKGVDGQVRDMCAVGKDLYACGDWGSVDKKEDSGVETNQVARWDGAKWNPLEKLNVDRQIYAMASDGKYLYVGGNFTKIAGKIDGHQIAKWDGKSWSQLPEVQYAVFKSVAVYNGVLYAGGDFQGGQFQGVCKFINDKWEPAYN